MLKKIIKFSLPTFFSAAIGIVSTPIVTRSFDTAELGKINLFLTYLTLIYTFCLMGLDQSFIRFYNETIEGEDKKSLLATCLKLTLLFVFTFSFLILLFRTSVSKLITGLDNMLIPFFLCIGIIGSVLNRFLQSNSRMEENAFLYSFQAIGYVVITKIAFVLSAFFNPTHVNAIGIISVGCLTLGLSFVFKEKDKIKWNSELNKDTIILLFKYGAPLMPSVLLVLLNNSISQILLSRFLDYSMVGVYSSAVTIANLISLIQSGFNTYWSAFVWKNYMTEQETIQQMHHIITFVMSLFGICIILFQDVLYLFLGENYRGGKNIFAFLIVSPICYTIAETTGLGIGISKKSYLNTIITAITLLANVILCVVLVPTIGMLGGAISSAVSGILFLVMRTITGEKFYKCIAGKIRTSVSLIIVITACLSSYFFQGNAVIRNYLCIVLAFALIINYKNMFNTILSKFRGNH